MFSRFKSTFSLSKKPASVDNTDCRKRNRLSKPPTNTSSLNLSSLSLLQPAFRSSTLFPLSTPNEELHDQSPLGSNDESREVVKAHLFGPESEDPEVPPQPATKSRKGAALVSSDIETQHSTSPTPRSPLASPSAAIFSISRLSLISSIDHKDVKERTPPKADNRSATASREDLTSPIPFRRKSLRQPGVATRIKKDERWGPSPPGEAGVDADRDYYYNPVFPEEASGTELEALNLETPRARKPVRPLLVRTDTPSDLVFLGGLKLGSLHVTNGRASPAPSDLSGRVKARSTPNLRTASSEYGDSDQEDGDTDTRALTGDGSPQRPSMPEVPPRLTSQAPRYQSPLRFSSEYTILRINTTRDYADPDLQVRKRPYDIDTANQSLDRCTSMAEDYMAELPVSPFAVARRSSTSQSMLDPTTKSTEFDDNLFEDESETSSESDSADNSTVGTLYSSNGATDSQDKRESSPQKLSPACTLADSGDGSNPSLRAAQEDFCEEEANEETKAMNPLGAASYITQNEPTIPKKRQDRRPGPRPIRPSILKQAGATTTSLPTFENLRHSSTTISTVMTTASTPPTNKPRRLTKLRLLSRSAPKEITVSGNHEVLTGSIPPIPVEFTANLAIRSQQVPELEHTFETRQHTAESPTTSHFDPVEVRFPSPAASHDGFDHASSAPPRPPTHRQSTFRRRSKSDKRSGVRHESHDMSEADALALIQDFGTVGHSLGGNPYDIARTNFQSSPRRNEDLSHQMDPHNITSATRRPKSVGGMDAETAAELARIRSRTIYERDSMGLAEKRNLFNDRGGLPGKNLRPMSFAANTPPLPSLPAGFANNQRQSWAPQTTRPQLQQVNSWRPNSAQPVHNHNTQMQAATEQSSYDYWDGPTSNHVRENESRSEDYQHNHRHSENERRQSWRADRVQIDFVHRNSRTQSHEESGSHRQCEVDSHYETEESWPRWEAAHHTPHHWNEAEEDAPPPPPPHSPRPMSIAPAGEEDDTWAAYGQAWEARRQSAGEALRYASNSRPYEQDDSLYPEIPPRNAPSSQAYNDGHAEQSNTYRQYPDNTIFTPEASYGSHHGRSNSQNPPRPHSQANSYSGSYAASLAESLHPLHDPPRVSPSPQFGRYSGGFSYGYERGSGFGGSAGTRSVSGVAGASRKGKELSAGFGVDLSDVPIIAGLKKL